MFEWYRKSKICYIYLADVEGPDGLATMFSEDLDTSDPEAVAKMAECIDSLSTSRWFTRRWTLQGLLAPSEILFFTKSWRLIQGEVSWSRSKLSQRPLLQIVSDITRIQLDAIIYRQTTKRCSNGEKMSWMAHRQKTRVGDTAYCLLGIFDINMPLLYGEGEKAFKRLQEEIIKQSTDFSLFGWQWPESRGWLNLGG
jgi:hypothetical protein